MPESSAERRCGNRCWDEEMRSSIRVRDGSPSILTCGDHRDDYRTHKKSGGLKSGHSFDDRRRRLHYIYSDPHPAIWTNETEDRVYGCPRSNV